MSTPSNSTIIPNSRPDPDPTVLTTAQLLRVNDELKQLIFTRLDAMDKAMSLFNENITRVPTDTDKQIMHLRELIFERFETQNEKFLSVQKQFEDRDVRVDQAAKDAKISLDAALSSAEKAVTKQNESFSLSISKSEAATIKQIEQLGTLFANTTAANSDKITDLKDRMTLIEGQNVGLNAQVAEKRAVGASNVSTLGVTAAIVLGLLSLFVTVALHWK